MSSSDLTPDEAANQRWWDAQAAAYIERSGAFIAKGLAWGVWQIPEAELNVLGDVSGKDVLELGCGAAEWSRALARLGARPVALDLSAERIAQARAAMGADGLDFPLLQASALAVPCPDASFDVVFCDYGATHFADPYALVPEVARLLRPGGVFAFSGAAPFAWVALDRERETWVEELRQPYFGMHRHEWPDGVVEYQLAHGEWIRLFRESGFEIEALIEVQPPEGAVSTYREGSETDFSRRWPTEEIWKVRRR
jgi:SAM-dependent methyltransferase